MKEFECPGCGEMIPDDSRFCDQCGKEILQCISCGTLGVDRFCPECGKPMIARTADKTTPSADDKSRAKGNDDVNKTTPPPAPKQIVLKARKGGFILTPQHEAIIGRTVPPYDKYLSSHSLISRSHGKFLKRGSGWYIIDLGSTNGTLVNDEELTPDIPVKFKVGDVIDIGTYIFDVIEQ